MACEWIKGWRERRWSDLNINSYIMLFFQRKVSFEPTTSYLLKNLKPFSTYIFQLAAKSKNGIGAYTNEVSIDTPQTRRSLCRMWECVCVCVCVWEKERSMFQLWQCNFQNPNRYWISRTHMSKSLLNFEVTYLFERHLLHCQKGSGIQTLVDLRIDMSTNICLNI